MSIEFVPQLSRQAFLKDMAAAMTAPHAIKISEALTLLEYPPLPSEPVPVTHVFPISDNREGAVIARLPIITNALLGVPAGNSVVSALKDTGVQTSPEGLVLAPFYKRIERINDVEKEKVGFNFLLTLKIPAGFFRLSRIQPLLQSAIAADKLPEMIYNQIPPDLVLKLYRNAGKNLPQSFLTKHAGDPQLISDVKTYQQYLYQAATGYLLSKYPEEKIDSVFIKQLAKSTVDGISGTLGNFTTDSSDTALSPDTEINTLQHLFSRKSYQLFGLLKVTEIEMDLIRLLDPTVLSDLLNNIYDKNPALLDEINIINKFSSDQFLSLFYTGKLKPQTMAYLINNRELDYRYTAAMALLVSANNIAVGQPERNLLLSKITNTTLAEMTTTMIPASALNPNMPNPDLNDTKRTTAEIWSDFLINIGSDNPERLVEILTLVEKKGEGRSIRGMTSRQFFQFAKEKGNFAFLLKTEEFALKKYKQGRDENSFLVWSASYLSGDPAIANKNFKPDIRNPNRPSIVPQDAEGRRKLAECFSLLGEYGSLYLIHQLGLIDSKINSITGLPTIFEEVISLLNEPYSNVTFGEFAKSVAIYLSLDNGATPNADNLANLITQTVDKFPLAAAVLFLNLPNTKVVEAANKLDKTTLQKCLYALLAYHISYLRQPFTTEDYEARMADALNQWPSTDNFPGILAGVFNVGQDELKKMLGKIAGKEKNSGDFSEFLLRDFYGRFCQGDLILSKSDSHLEEKVSIVTPDGLIDLGAIVNTNEFFNTYRIQITALGLKNEANSLLGFKTEPNRIRCKAKIMRRDKKSLSDQDRGSLRSYWGNFWYGLTLGKVNLQDPIYVNKFAEISKNGELEIALNPDLLGNPVLMEDVNALGIPVFMRYQLQTNGKIWTQEGKEPTLYELTENSVKKSGNLLHDILSLPLIGKGIDIDWKSQGDAQGYFVQQRQGPDGKIHWYAFITIPGSPNPNTAYALDIEELYRRSLKSREQFFPSDKEKAMATLTAFAIVEWRTGLVSKVGGKIIGEILKGIVSLVR